MIYKIYCKKKNEKNFEDYNNMIINNKKPEDEVKILNYFDNTLFMKLLDKESIHIFLYRIPVRILLRIKYYEKNNIKIYFLNTEQLSLEHHFEYVQSLPKYIKIIDYSLGNFFLINQLKRQSYCLPYTIYPKEDFSKIPKTKDICMIFPGNGSLRRHNILHQLRKNKIPVDVIKGYGHLRDMQLFQYKIILNVHYNIGYKIFEEIRCNRCIFNKMIVISESSAFPETNYLKNHMIIVPYNDFVKKVEDVCKNYEKYHKELFENYNENEIKNYYNNFYNKFFGENNNIALN
jgi:hypothetical protein